MGIFDNKEQVEELRYVKQREKEEKERLIHRQRVLVADLVLLEEALGESLYKECGYQNDM